MEKIIKSRSGSSSWGGGRNDEPRSSPLLPQLSSSILESKLPDHFQIFSINPHLIKDEIDVLSEDKMEVMMPCSSRISSIHKRVHYDSVFFNSLQPLLWVTHPEGPVILSITRTFARGTSTGRATSWAAICRRTGHLVIIFESRVGHQPVPVDTDHKPPFWWSSPN